MKNIWKILFGIACILQLLALLLRIPTLVFVSKPLLMPLLAAWLASETVTSRFLSKAWLSGLIFSTLGDVLLMFARKEHGEIFFVLGLAMFLLAHLFYIGGLWFILKGKEGFLRKRPIWALVPVLYLLGLMAYLWPNIPPGLQFPVGAYALVITTMATSVLSLRTYVTMPVFRLMMLGALLFVLSDSLLALEKFGNLPSAPLSIMATYIFGQAFMALGVMRFINEK
jgi:uncharacterized membrane protein YhhN